MLSSGSTSSTTTTPQGSVPADAGKWKSSRNGELSADLGPPTQPSGQNVLRNSTPLVQTTVAKTEAADRPLRVNEVADLARVLGVRVPDLVSTDHDWALRSIDTTLAMYGSHVHRLESEIEELNRQVAVKAQTLEETRKRIRELHAEFNRVNGER
jgi:uncharacterized coiled-coil protein SlyX